MCKCSIEWSMSFFFFYEIALGVLVRFCVYVLYACIHSRYCIRQRVLFYFILFYFTLVRIAKFNQNNYEVYIHSVPQNVIARVGRVWGYPEYRPVR